VDKKAQKKILKLFFSILGRQPHSFALVLDEGGWCSYKELFRILHDEPDFSWITPLFIKQFFPLYRPDDFEWREDAVRVKPELCAFEADYFQTSHPPAHLFAAVRPKFHASVISNGLFPAKSKKWLLLCADEKKARKIGKRLDNEPIIAEILAQKASSNGVEFKYYGEGLYLAENIPPEWLVMPQVKEEQRITRPKKTDQASNSRKDVTVEEIGSFLLRAPEEKSNHGKVGNKGEKHYRDKEPAWKDARRNTRRH